MSRTVGIIGMGVLGRQLLQMLVETHGAVTAVYFDDLLVGANAPDAVPFGDHGKPEYASLDFYVGLGYQHLATKQRLIAELQRAGRRLPAFVHASAYIDRNAIIGDAVVLFPRCTIGSGVSIAAGALLHCAATLAHDIAIGPSSYIGPGVTISGDVAIGARSFLGTGTAVANGVGIGDDAIVGIGTCVTRDVASGASVIGNPMRVLGAPLVLR